MVHHISPLYLNFYLFHKFIENHSILIPILLCKQSFLLMWSWYYFLILSLQFNRIRALVRPTRFHCYETQHKSSDVSACKGFIIQVSCNSSGFFMPPSLSLPPSPSLPPLNVGVIRQIFWLNLSLTQSMQIWFFFCQHSNLL